MYAMITAYDVMDRIQLRVRIIDNPEQAEILTESFKATVTLPLPAEGHSDRDLLAIIGEELLNLAYRESPV